MAELDDILNAVDKSDNPDTENKDPTTSFSTSLISELY